MSTATTTARRATVTTPTDRQILIERIFDAPRDRVWRAFTEPALLAQWWGRGNKLVIERFELERGGHWRFVEHAPEGVNGFEGRFREACRRVNDLARRHAPHGHGSNRGQGGGGGQQRRQPTRATAAAV